MSVGSRNRVRTTVRLGLAVGIPCQDRKDCRTSMTSVFICFSIGNEGCVSMCIGTCTSDTLPCPTIHALYVQLKYCLIQWARRVDDILFPFHHALSPWSRDGYLFRSAEREERLRTILPDSRVHSSEHASTRRSMVSGGSVFLFLSLNYISLRLIEFEYWAGQRGT